MTEAKATGSQGDRPRQPYRTVGGFRPQEETLLFEHCSRTVQQVQARKADGDSWLSTRELTNDEQAAVFIRAVDNERSYFDEEKNWDAVCRCIDEKFALVDKRSGRSVLSSLGNHFGVTSPWRKKVGARMKAAVGENSPLGLILSTLESQYVIGDLGHFGVCVFSPCSETRARRFLSFPQSLVPRVAAYLSGLGHCMPRDFADSACEVEGGFQDAWLHSDITWSVDVLKDGEAVIPHKTLVPQAFRQWKGRVEAAVESVLLRQLASLVYDYYMPIIRDSKPCHCESCEFKSFYDKS